MEQINRCRSKIADLAISIQKKKQHKEKLDAKLAMYKDLKSQLTSKEQLKKDLNGELSSEGEDQEMAMDTLGGSKKHMVNGIKADKIPRENEGSGCADACCTIF